MAEDADNSEGESPAAVAQRYIAELAVSRRFQEKWLKRARNIAKRYEADFAASDSKRRFSMLWSNTQTIAPVVYSRPPQAVVSRRFKDNDPVGRLASEVLERAVNYSVDKQDLDGVLRNCVLDYVLIARAQVWERYVPTHGPTVTPKITVTQVGNAPDEELWEDTEGKRYAASDVKEDQGERFVEGEPYEPIVYEQSITDFVNWEDFGFWPARTWEEVPVVWRRVYMGRQELIARFGREIGRAVPLDWGDKDKSDAEREHTCKAAVYEIWDKRTRDAVWISESYSAGPLDRREDPLGLDGFFPCPRPLFGTLAPGKLNPTPDFIYYQDQADEIDSLTARIGELQAGLRVRGFYAGDIAEDLNTLLSAKNNTLIPVASWRTVEGPGGLDKKIEWFPIDAVVQALKACIELRRQLIEDVYSITGVSDIQRGASDPRETASAQTIKANFGSLRVRDRQNEVVRFARDILRIKGEVIAEHFGPETLAAITGMKLPTNADKQAAMMQVEQAKLLAASAAQGGQPAPAPAAPPEVEQMLASPSWEDVIGLLRDDQKRQFRVDIESDSTIEPNESEEKARTVEFVQAVGGFFNQITPIVQAAPETAPMFSEIVKFTARRFRAGRELEDVIERTMDQIAAKAAQPAPGAATPEPPDRTPVEVAQLNLERERVRAQGQVQAASIDAGVAQGDQAIRQADQQLKLVYGQRDPNPQVTA